MTCGCALSFHILCIDVLEKNDIFLVFVFSEDVLCSKQMAIVIFSQVINAPYVYISSRGQWFKSPTGNSLILNLHGVQVQLKVYIYIIKYILKTLIIYTVNICRFSHQMAAGFGHQLIGRSVMWYLFIVCLLNFQV